MKKRIKIFYTDFWPKFNIEDNYFNDLLSKRFDIELSADNPDFLIYSVFGNQFRRYKCPRIIYIGENVRPNFNECDYAFSFDYDSHGGRNFRLPHYALYTDPEILTKPLDVEKIISGKRKFCSFIYSNPNCGIRNRFFKKLSEYKKVDSGGRLFNNMGSRVKDKVEFLSSYKFNIAFENESYPGYTTEKILEPMLVGTIPIYWGNEYISREFNAKSFINYFDFDTEKEMISRINEIDNDDNLYAEILSEPFYPGNKVNKYVDTENILNQFENIFTDDIEPVGEKSSIFSGNRVVARSSLAASDIKYQFIKYYSKLRGFRPYKLKIKYEKYFKKF